MVYNWEQLRDVAEPDYLKVSRFENKTEEGASDELMAAHALDILQ